MATGALDANGIWLYGEDDSEPTFSGLLNKLGQSTSDTVTRLESFTGYTGTLGVANGGTGATTVAAARASIRVGLVPISPSSVQYAGTSASANTLGKVTAQGVTSVSLNGVFSSSYDKYVIYYSFGASANFNMNVRLRASGTDNSSANYSFGGEMWFQNGTNTSFSTGNSGTFTILGTTAGATDRIHSGTLQVFNPANSFTTTFVNDGSGYDATKGVARVSQACRHAVGSAFDGITFFPGSGSASEFMIQVFGVIE